MGFFSWITADTNESVPSVHSSRRTFDVYVLQPNGGKPIKEEAYEGYGIFGGRSIYTLLAEWNFGDSRLESLAINADCGHFYVDKNGVPYLCQMHWDAIGIQAFFAERPVVTFESYLSYIDHLGCTANEAIERELLYQKK